ncbi:MAG: hypothetical protein L3J73_03210 [Thermoplasmata archaeon]|nr:hypothetical protein [Thermoplasmata archaeon]
MRTGRLFGDLSLLEQGVEVAAGFGLRSIEGLVDVAELLEQSVYEPRSLRRTPTGFGFTLLNPPLRMGAFSSLKLIWNGTAVDASEASIILPDAAPRSFGSIDRSNPVSVPVGRRSRFEVASETVVDGRHHLRLELQSVAVPPLVWFEFSDELRAPDAAPR